MFTSTQQGPGFLSSDPYLTQTGPNLDPNSPEVFRQNLQLVQQHTMQVHSLAQSAQAGMYVHSLVSTWLSANKHEKDKTLIILARTHLKPLQIWPMLRKPSAF